MHPNPAFRKTPEDARAAFALAQGFGVLAVPDKGAPLLSHVPFVLSEDASYAELHLVRSNPIARVLKEPLDARLAVQGPHGYISPDWYGVDDQVPTWNYVAVHLTGKLERRPEGGLRDTLERLSEHFEAQLAPKPVWRIGKMTGEALEKMLRQILPYRRNITSIDGTWKLGQNKPCDVRQHVAEALKSSPVGMERKALAKLMEDAAQN